MAFPTEKASDNDFRLLGLPTSASPDEVKKAYRELVKRWHPDRFQQHPILERRQAEEHFKEITGAYRRISLHLQSPRSEEWGTEQSARPKPTTPRDASSQSRTGSKPAGPPPRSAAPPHARSRRTGPSIPRSSWMGAAFQCIRRIHQRGIIIRNRHSTGAVLLLLLFLVIFGITSIPDLKWLPFRPADLPTGHEALRGVTHQPPGAPSPEESAPPSEEIPSAELHHPSPPPGLPPISPRSQLRSFFSLGSPQSEVLRIQGPPDRVHGQTWIYGLSEIQFRNGQVLRYNNFDGSLRIRILPAPVPKEQRPRFLTVGSSKNDVLLIQGTPNRIEPSKWYYGLSEIRFRNDVLDEFDNYFGDLHIRMTPENPSASVLRQGFFTVGSTTDDVLALQGTPTSIQGNYWFYQSSNILFRQRKVLYAVNSGRNLRFVPPDEIPKPESEPRSRGNSPTRSGR